MQIVRRLTFYSLLAPVLLGNLTASAEVRILGAHFRADEIRPEFARFWQENLGLRAGDPAEKELRERVAAQPLGGSLHVFFRNDGPSAVKCSDLLLEDFSLTKVLAFSEQRRSRRPASIYFAKLAPREMERLQALGEPVWWKCDPRTIAPGAVGQAVVRLRTQPRSAEVRCTLEFDAGRIPAAIRVNPAQPRVDGVTFSDDRRQVFLYFRHPAKKGAAPSRILLDGADVTPSATIAADASIPVTPVVLRLTKALDRGSLHCFQGVYEDESVATGAVRVLTDEFAYGMWGGIPGKEADAEKARAHVRDLAEKSVNVQMPQVGSAPLQALYNSDAGRKFCESLGLRFLTAGPGKWRIEKPFAYFLKDEPDWADTRMSGMPQGRQVGSIAQWIIGTAEEMRAADPATPHLLNVNLGYKPMQWYTYGQLPDIFASDPYYQVRLWEAYGQRPQARAAYEKAEWIYAVSSISHTAGAPLPLHIVLYGCRRGEGKTEEDPEDGPAPARKKSTMYRWATPAEKRLEAYYAVAGGAKGLSYWWFTPTGGQSQGVGANHPEAKALWREIGLIGAEVRTAGPVLTRSCPADVPLKATPGLFARTLLAGADTLVLVVTNDQHLNTDKGTEIKPVKGAEVQLELPAWLKPRHTFAVDARGLADVRTASSGRSLTLPLGDLEVTRLVIITSDATLRGRLTQLHREKFAENVARLTSGN